MKTLSTVIPLLTIAIAAQTAYAQQAKPKTPPKKQPAIGTVGTAQMQGGDGLFGTTYTLANNGGYMFNVTLTRAEYTVVRHNLNNNRSLLPATGEKLLLLYMTVQNPKPTDAYVSRNFLSFATVAKDNQTRNHNDELRLVNAKEALQTTLKPGQKLPGEVVMGCIVPADGPVPKLIVNMGRKGTSEKVTRFALGTAPNLVKPLPKGDADPSDPSGATALTEVPAKVGETYPYGRYDVRVDSIAYAPGPIGSLNPGNGKRFLIITLSCTNKTWRRDYFNRTIAATLLTADDEKTENHLDLKGKRDERAEGRQVDPDETVALRLAFAVPKDTTGKTLKLSEILTNTNIRSRAFIFDLKDIP